MKLFLLGLLLLPLMAMGQQTPSQKNYDPPFNLLLNGNFEKKLSGWSNSGGTFAHVTSGSNLIFDKGSATFDASSTGQYVQTKLYAISEGLKGAACMGRVFYKGGDANLTLQAVDGSSNVLASSVFATSTITVQNAVVFTCPSTGSVRLKILSSANAAVIAIDNAHIGIADNLSQLSQASFSGSLTIPAATGCVWGSAIAGFNNFPAESSCSGSPTVTGNLSYIGSKVPGFTYANMPAGEYQVTISSGLGKNGALGAVAYRLSDGTINSDTSANYFNTSVEYAMGTQSFHLSIPTTGTRSFQVQCSSGASTCLIDNDPSIESLGITFNVYRFPTATQQVYTADTVGWLVDANVGGANPALGGVTSTYSEITDSGLDIVQNSGSTSVMIPCSGTNPSTGLTCAAGNESIGVVFDVPRAGAVEVCADFSVGSTAGTNQSNDAGFQLIETPNNAQTILQEGKTRVYYQNAHASASNNVTEFSSMHVCGTFNFASSGQKTVRLMYESSTIATVVAVQADRGATLGQPDVHFTAKPLNQQVPAPILTNSVISKSDGVERLVRFKVGSISGGECTSDPCTITSQSGGITSVNRTSLANYDINFAVGTFSGPPVCTIHTQSTGLVMHPPYQSVNASSTLYSFGTYQSSNALADSTFEGICMGPR